MLSKAEIRHHIKKKHLQFSSKEHKKASKTIESKLKTYLTQQPITQVALFYPTPTEPALPLAWLIETFQNCYAPIYKNNNYQFYKLSAPYETKKGQFNIDEPTTFQPANPDILYSTSTAVLIPGIAFTKQGHRIGHGAGIYDRLLPPFKGPLIGIGFEYQIFDTLPCEKHDVQCDLVFYEKT